MKFRTAGPRTVVLGMQMQTRAPRPKMVKLGISKTQPHRDLIKVAMPWRGMFQNSAKMAMLLQPCSISKTDSLSKEVTITKSLILTTHPPRLW